MQNELFQVVSLALAAIVLPQGAIASDSSGQERAPPTEVPLSVAQPPRSLADGAEVYVASGYEPSAEQTTVVVDRPGKKILLVLTSGSPVHWVLEHSADTLIVGVLVGGRSTLDAPAGIRGYSINLPYAYDLENINFNALLLSLNQQFGVEAIDGFHAAYRIPSLISMSSPDKRRPELTVGGVTPTTPRRTFRFGLPDSDGKLSTWTLSGPVNNTDVSFPCDAKVALSPSGQVLYRAAESGLDVIDLRTGSSSHQTIPSEFPQISWPMDVAYDTDAGIVSLVTLGGEGFLYRYDAAHLRWLDFKSMQNLDVLSLTYDRVGHRYLGWTTDGELVFLDRGGAIVEKRSLRSRLPGFRSFYDSGNEPTPRLTVTAKGLDVALVYIAGGKVRAIWRYGIDDDSAQLTYRSGNDVLDYYRVGCGS